MKTKIILLASILSLIVIGSIVGFAVFGGDKECSHQWGEWSTTISATCTQSGTQEHKCSKCGETQSSTIEALGHDWSEATCSAPKTCKICSATEGTASAHTYTVETVKEESLKSEATCTQAAVYYKSCSCGAISTSEEDTFISGDPIAHSFTLETVKDEALKSGATCTQAAVYYKSCSCGAISTSEEDTFVNGEALEHIDENNDHACDLGCGTNVGTCEDEDKDHACDYGCGKSFGEHADGDDNDHLCDYDCGKIADEGCYDAVIDGKCDECGAAIEHTCIDENNDHACDICSAEISKHIDSNKDHICDNGCDKIFGSCTDSNRDHRCDYGCGKSFGTCKDNNKDHRCDYGCGRSFGIHSDNGNHFCDYCNIKVSNCYNNDADGKCDECGQEIAHDCLDEDINHACDFCSAEMGMDEHTDSNYDHICDYGCDQVFGEHSDLSTDSDHLCEYCGGNAEDCFDAENDGDHSCDVCGKAEITGHNNSEASCAEPATCSECQATTGSTLDHIDENLDHICDNECGKNDIGEHTDGDDNDHLCDYGCNVVLENCSDVQTDRDHNCDECGKENVTAHVFVEDQERSTAATCTQAAKKIWVCDCGDEHPEDVGDALNHDIANAEAEEIRVEGSNCVCEYVLVYECQRGDCREKVFGETVYKHEYVAIITTPATCNSDGEKTFKCSKCGDESKPAETILADATGHNWVSGAVENGARTDTCSLCGETKNVTVYTGTTTDEINAGDLADKEIELNNANISLDSGVINTIGDQNITLSADKFEGTDRESIVSGPDLLQVGDNPIYNFTINNGTENISNFGDNYVTITLPYELEEGEDVDSIAVWFINDQGELESIKATYNNGFVTFKTNHFSYYTVTRLTPEQRCELYGHGFAEQVVEGSCTKDGYVLCVCVRCHKKEIKEGSYVKADGHDYETETHEATCTESGYTLYKCKDCEHSYKTKINANGHEWNVIDSADATCTEDGYIMYGCENCEQEYTEIIVKTGHEYTDTEFPATCSEVGYTIRECNNCDYSCTDFYVDALGHDYKNHAWSWESNGNKATLTFNCANDETHKLEIHVISDMEKVVEKGECSNYVKRTHTATVEYNGQTYTDVLVIRQGNPSHKFPEEWTKNETEHWHECICGERADLAEHLFENEEIVEPTCVEAGKITSYCECGEVKEEIIPATGEHNYIDGICDSCGKEYIDCDHTEINNREYIDFGELGACDWILYYYTCDCGEVKMIDENSDIACDLEYTQNQFVDENGNECQAVHAVCDCGFEMNAIAVIAKNDCVATYTINYEFKFNGEVVIEMSYVNTSESHNTTGSEIIYLSEYGICGGTLRASRCYDCGEIVNAYSIDVECNIDEENAETEEVVDENGFVHYIQTVECPDCDFIGIIDTWVEELSVCEKIIHSEITVRCGETEIVKLVENRYENNHDYQYTYELEGETCSDGYYVNVSCSICGYSNRIYETGHSTARRRIEFSELGLCGGYAEESYCVICDEVVDIYLEDYYCNWLNMGTNEDGYDIYKCHYCGATKLSTSDVGEKDENCAYVRTTTVIYIINDEEVYRYEDSFKYTHHDFRYDFKMDGESCTDGYTCIETCKDCDYYRSSYHTVHICYQKFVINGENTNYCEEHYIYIAECPCGKEFGIDYSNFDYNDQSEMYECYECGLALAHSIEEVEEGCERIETTYCTVYYGEEVLYTYEGTKTYANHEFTDIEISEGEQTIITSTCEKCKQISSSELLSVQMQDHSGQYYCDYTFVPSESAMYTIESVSDRDTYVTLYKMEGDNLIRIDYDYDDGYGTQFLLSAYLTEGTTYVYRIGFLYGDAGIIHFFMNKGIIEQVSCEHNYSESIAMLINDAETCEDGALYGNLCKECSSLRSIRVEYDHIRSETERINLTEFGGCNGEVIYYSCACGQNQDVYVRAYCYTDWTNNKYYDEEGRLIQVEVRSCSNCGLRNTTSYYTVKNRTNCTLTYYYSVVVNIGNTLIFEKEYTRIEIDHDYENTAILVNGEGSSCEDGVTITYSCKDCEERYSEQIHYHMTLEKESIDLSEYGCVCGGNVNFLECACGEVCEVSLDNSLCDWGSKRCELWIDGVIDEGQYNMQYPDWWASYSNNAYIYTCAVTDPEDKACGFKYRYAQYWLKDENSCMAYRYQTWQFGYDEQTGEYDFEFTFKTGNSRIYHNYVDNSENGNTKYDCPDCGSYYYLNNYYDENGNHIKREVLISNTFNRDYNKYYEHIEEYAYLNDIDYISRVYHRTVDFNDSEYWFEELRSEELYTGPFGDEGRKVTIDYEDSHGENYLEENAYVYYKGYSFTIYNYITTSSEWNKYDYTYTFDNGCVQTEIYTNSYGKSRKTVRDICRMYDYETIKYPTCSQDGEERYQCTVCDKYSEIHPVSANDHSWVKVSDNWYYCFICGLENANGVSGSIIMEDLTEVYGNGENYVVGYCALNNVEFTKYISLILADENQTEVAIWSGIDFIQIEGVRAFAFSKQAVADWAAENGYTDYNVRFSFVPIGSDSSFDYGITFTETTEHDTIIDNVSFIDYIGKGEVKSYTITPTEDGIWTFTSSSNHDTYGCLYDAEGNCLDEDDDGGEGNNFVITYELKAGETYTIKVRWYYSDRAGKVALLFGWEAVDAE